MPPFLDEELEDQLDAVAGVVTAVGTALTGAAASATLIGLAAA